MRIKLTSNEFELKSEKTKIERERKEKVVKKKEGKKTTCESAIERKKREGKQILIAKVKDVRRVLFSNQPLLVLICKEVLFSTNKLDVSLPNVIITLLYEYQDIFLKT